MYKVEEHQNEEKNSFPVKDPHQISQGFIPAFKQPGQTDQPDKIGNKIFPQRKEKYKS